MIHSAALVLVCSKGAATASGQVRPSHAVVLAWQCLCVCLSVYEMKCVTLHAARSGDGHFYQRGNECLNCGDSSKEAPRGRGEGEGPTLVP